jgi:hypothetical protein
MSWNIIPQIEKIKKEEVEVKCKHLKAFPIDNNGETVFGRFKFLMLRVIMQHDKEQKDHVITYNDRGGFNTFIYHWPTKAQGQNTFTSLESLYNFLSNRGEIATEVTEAFAQRIGVLTTLRKELNDKKIAKQEAKEAKAKLKADKAAEKAAKKAEREARKLAKAAA